MFIKTCQYNAQLAAGMNGIRFQGSDRAEPLLKGIDYISKVEADATRLGNFEAIYQTKGDFSVITFSSSGKIEEKACSPAFRPLHDTHGVKCV